MPLRRDDLKGIDSLMRRTNFVVSVFTATVMLSSQRAQARDDDGHERAVRQTSVIEIAPAPLDAGVASGSILIGDEGKDEYGYPRKYVDRALVRSLLLHRRFGELTAHVEHLQSAFEQDYRREYWVYDAADALGTGEVELRPLLDAWVQASPGSFAPLLARGTYWVSRSQLRRGSKWAKDTPAQDFASMHAALPRGLADLERAAELRPKLVAAMRQQIKASSEDSRAIIERALRACPRCFQVRVAYLYELTPRWGGSYEEMSEFIRRTDQSNPRAALLSGYIDLDRADQLRRDKDPLALTVAERACALGAHWEFLLGRARVQLALEKPEAALSDLNQAVALRPGYPALLFERARAHLRLKHWEEAGLDLRAALQVEPPSEHGRVLLPICLQGLLSASRKAAQAHDRDGALRILDLAGELGPQDLRVREQRSLIMADRGPSDAGVQERRGGQ